MYQAMQNILVGFGAVLGASLGGMIAETVGWRWCFLAQVPVSLLALVVGNRVLENPADIAVELSSKSEIGSALLQIDVLGAVVLVLGLITQILGLSLGGNEVSWTSPVVIGTLVVSSVLLAMFVFVEAETKASPMVPLGMLKGWQPVSVQLTNIFSGMASYAVSVIPPHVIIASHD